MKQINMMSAISENMSTSRLISADERAPSVTLAREAMSLAPVARAASPSMYSVRPAMIASSAQRPSAGTKPVPSAAPMPDGSDRRLHPTWFFISVVAAEHTLSVR